MIKAIIVALTPAGLVGVTTSEETFQTMDECFAHYAAYDEWAEHDGRVRDFYNSKHWIQRYTTPIGFALVECRPVDTDG